MEENWQQTNIGPETSQRSSLHQHHPNPRPRLRQQTRILLLPGGKLHKTTVISSHTSPSIEWLKPAKEIPEWIIQIYNFLRPYSSYYIYTDGSHDKSSQAYDGIFLADNGTAHPDRISAGASIIIAPQLEDWRDIKHSTLLCIHI